MIKPSTASKEHLPVIKKAWGKHCWDLKNKRYLDFTGANLTTILGYRQFRFKKSPNFPGKSELEDNVSKKLSKYTKTKYFRYFKNGHNAVDCAIRIAGGIFGQSYRVGFIGYAGTSDLYIWTTENKRGVKPQMSWQISNFENQIPIDILVFESRYFELAKKVDCEFKICDHLKSGINGLWENIESDFHLYGKSLANGYPVAVMTGKNKYMKRIDEIYYSTTFGGDNVGLEAIEQTLKKYDRKKWLKLKEYADSVLPPWQSLKPEQIKKFTKEGVLFNGYWAILMSHAKEDIDRLASLCKKIL